jgi:hypothetical protein
MKAVRVAAGIFMAALTACGSDPEPDPRSVLDTTSAATPLVRIGQEPGMELVGAPLISLLMPDGGVLIADSQENTLIRVNADGRTEWRTGRRGQAPGEFSEISAVLEAPDGTFRVVDRSLNRVTSIDGSGRMIETRRMALIGDGTPHVISVDEHGALIAVARAIATDLSGTTILRDDTMRLYRERPERTSWQRVGVATVGDALIIHDRGIARVLPLYQGSLYVQRCGNEIRFISARGVISVSLDGDLRQLVEPSGLRVRYAGTIEQLSAAFLQSIGDEAARQSAAQLLQRRVDVVLWQSRLVLPDRSGRLWMRSARVATRGVYEAWDGDVRHATVRLAAPRFWTDADPYRLLMFSPGTDSAFPVVEVYGAGSRNDTDQQRLRAEVRCDRAVRVGSD